MRKLQKSALLCTTSLCLGSIIFEAPVQAGSFSVGGGSIVTSQTDNATDNTGTNGGFILQPNTTGNNDTVTINGVTINNTSGAPNGRALDMGYTQPSTGSYSIVMHGSSLTAQAGSGVAALLAETSAGGSISFDSTGGAANLISGPIGITLAPVTSNINVSIKTGADTITTSGASGEILYGVAGGAGTVSIDTIGATLTSSGTYGIVASTGTGAVTIGGLNGGMASALTVTNGNGIYISGVGPSHVTIAAAGSVTAQTGVALHTTTAVVDNFGTVAASQRAVDGSTATSLTVTLESGSTTSGIVFGSGTTSTFNIFGGANVTGATFDGGTGSATLDLQGSGNGSFAATTASHIAIFRKDGSGTWTLTGAPGATPWTIYQGNLAISSDANLGSGTTLVLAGGTLETTAGLSSARSISLSTGGGSIQVDTGTLSLSRGIVNGAGTPGGLTKTGSGTLSLTGTSTYNGATLVNAGVFRGGAANAFSAASAITVNSGGTLDLGGFAQSINTVLLAGGTLQNGALSGAISSSGGTVNGVSGGASFTASAGTTTLSGTNTYTGASSLSGGTVVVTGSFGTAGSPAGTVTLQSGGTLRVANGGSVNTGGNAIVNGGTMLIDAGGTVASSVSNSFMLTNAGTMSAGLTSSGGTVTNNGTIQGNTSVSGGTLRGTGQLGNTTIASGGTLSPGNNPAIGTLTVAGNLSLATGSAYSASLTPSAASLTNVTGTASLNGNMTAVFASGAYTLGQRYTVIQAAGGLSGTFAGVTTTGLPAYRGILSYDAKDVYLTLVQNLLSPLLTSPSQNQTNVAGAIDAAITAGAPLPAGFQALFGLSGTALNSALDQLMGQIGSNISYSVTASFSPFLDLMLSEAASAGGETMSAANSGNGSPYGADDVKPAQLSPGTIRLWGSVYGGHTGISANPVLGTAHLSADNVGFTLGAETELQPGLITGGSASFDRQYFSAGNGLGNSSDVLLGVFGRGDVFDQGYVAAALGYGWNRVRTNRTITVSGTDIVAAKFQAEEFGGRIEGGYRLALDGNFVLTPFAAFTGANFHTPAYSETTVSGSSTFALSYAGQELGVEHSEVGGRLDRDFSLDEGTLSATGMIGWAHQMGGTPSGVASFAALAGSVFKAYGAKLDRNSALLGLKLNVENGDGFFYGVQLNGDFGSHSAVIEGMGNLSYRW